MDVPLNPSTLGVMAYMTTSTITKATTVAVVTASFDACAALNSGSD